MASTAGYSGTPLAGKLGIKEGMTVVAIGAPKNYAALVAPLPDGATISTRLGSKPAFVHLFSMSRIELGKRLAELRGKIVADGVVWVSWPKRTAGVPTDITEDVIRSVALPLGFVDIKVCAVDATWSGLKLMIRKALR
jgi:hypothetical protein